MDRTAVERVGTDTGSVGADADALTLLGRRFVVASERLGHSRVQLASVFDTAGWVGHDAARARTDWRSAVEPALRDVGRFVDDLGRRLIEHAHEQRGASAGTSPAPQSGLGFASGVDVVDRVRDAIDDLVDDLVGGWFGDGPDPSSPDDHLPDEPNAARIVGLRPQEFVRPEGGRDAVLMAMQGLAEEDRIARDEIEIRALDNGRYVVVLPGVTDLSDGFDRFVAQVRADGPLGAPGAGRDAIEAWADNDEPTVRKMRYAFEAARSDDTTVNEYSVATLEALEAAGVPRGAEVMIVGHSFGAYTAIDLAADPAANAVHGAEPTGFHLEVTHVIAAGAETDWRFDEVPADTSTLVLNNRFDGVYRAEDLLHADGHARHDGHLEHDFWGGWQGYGHDEHNYIEWLAGTGDDGIEAWLADAGRRYTAGGTRVSARVPDPYL